MSFKCNVCCQVYPTASDVLNCCREAKQCRCCERVVGKDCVAYNEGESPFFGFEICSKCRKAEDELLREEFEEMMKWKEK